MQIAVVQFEPGSEVDGNRNRAENHIREAVRRGAELVVLPEIWNVGYFAFEQYRSKAESIDGPTITHLRELAAELEVYLHTGSIVERDGEQLYNTSALIGPKGNILDTYRKLHLFGYESEERQLLTPGERIVAVDTAFGTVGMATCYDLRFPELFRALLESGVELLLVTSAWPAARLEHWQLLTRTRAMENQMLLAAANLAGEHAGVELAGRSCVVDPTGILRADAGVDSGSAVVDVDLSAVENVRTAFPVLEERRIDPEYTI